MFAAIAATEYHLPKTQITNQQIAAAHPEWTAQPIPGQDGDRNSLPRRRRRVCFRPGISGGAKTLRQRRLHAGLDRFSPVLLAGGRLSISRQRLCAAGPAGPADAHRGPGLPSRLFGLCLRAGPGEGIDRNQAGEQCFS